MKTLGHLLVSVISAVATAFALFILLLYKIGVSHVDVVDNALVGATVVSFLLAIEHCVKNFMPDE